MFQILHLHLLTSVSFLNAKHLLYIMPCMHTCLQIPIHSSCQLNWYNLSPLTLYSHSITYYILFQFSSVAQLCPTLCNPMNHSTPGLPVHHQLPESTQTHVHCVSDAFQPSHPLSSPSPPALNLSQHQGLFQ